MSTHRLIASELIRQEAAAVAALADRLDSSFDAAVEAILSCAGRVIIAGMGKSGLIGRKIVATLNSTGTSAYFLHPAEALHGDIGVMRTEDILVVISKSGQLDEIDLLFATARRLSISVIALCGTPESELARRADIVIDCSVSQEACPNNLVPTSSSTAALVMGDAIAMALLSARNFTPADFAELHPGGMLGRRLLTHISELHHSGDDIPLVSEDASMHEMILAMTGKRLGCVVMVDKAGQVAGIFTDGDLRRLAEQNPNFHSLCARQAMIRNPKKIRADQIVDAALALMEKHSIAQLPTVDDQGKLVGVIHLHDILKSKLV